MSKTVNVTADHGVPFVVRLVQSDKIEVKALWLAHRKHKSMLEFYDARHPFHSDREGNTLGQFVSRYYTDTILKAITDGNGLNLYGSVPAWRIDHNTLCRALVYLLLTED